MPKLQSSASEPSATVFFYKGKKIYWEGATNIGLNDKEVFASSFGILPLKTLQDKKLMQSMQPQGNQRKQQDPHLDLNNKRTKGWLQQGGFNDMGGTYLCKNREKAFLHFVGKVNFR
jgi:hypothetical protein